MYITPANLVFITLQGFISGSALYHKHQCRWAHAHAQRSSDSEMWHSKDISDITDVVDSVLDGVTKLAYLVSILLIWAIYQIILSRNLVSFIILLTNFNRSRQKCLRFLILIKSFAYFSSLHLVTLVLDMPLAFNTWQSLI